MDFRKYCYWRNEPVVMGDSCGASGSSSSSCSSSASGSSGSSGCNGS